MNKFILLIVFLFSAQVFADDVIFATGEDLAAFDQLVVKSRKNETRPATSTEIKNQVNEVVGSEERAIKQNAHADMKGSSKSLSKPAKAVSPLKKGKGKAQGRKK